MRLAHPSFIEALNGAPRATFGGTFYGGAPGLKEFLVPAVLLDPPRPAKIPSSKNCARRCAGFYESKCGALLALHYA